jgi:hypothetical protein
VESGLIAAEVISNMNLQSGDGLKVYAELIEARLGPTQPWRPWPQLPGAWLHWAARQLLKNRWFTRRIVLDHWFLGHAA